MEYPIKDFNLGADVEFVAVYKKSGLIRRMDDLIPETNEMRNNEEYYAIGKDGDRPTASLELRPGKSNSAEILVDNLYELIQKLEDTFHPPGIMYRTGAWVAPEPLGGHLHLSWSPTLAEQINIDNMDNYLSTRKMQLIWVRKIINGWRIMSNFLIGELFPHNEIQQRLQYALDNHKDFASEKSMRPHQFIETLGNAHVEYRYPPSWLLTPEHAYCFLGGAEFIVRHVTERRKLTSGKWDSLVNEMFNKPELNLSPPNGPNLATAFKIAKSYEKWDVDFVENWS